MQETPSLLDAYEKARHQNAQLKHQVANLIQHNKTLLNDITVLQQRERDKIADWMGFSCRPSVRPIAEAIKRGAHWNPKNWVPFFEEVVEEAPLKKLFRITEQRVPKPTVEKRKRGNRRKKG